MLNDAVSVRYAGVLFDLACKYDKVRVWEQELEGVGSVLEKTDFLQGIFSYPFISADEKKDMLKKLFSGRIDPLLLNFLFVLVDYRRFSSLKNIVFSYKKRLHEAEGVADAYVTVAYKLTPELEEELSQALSAFAGKKIAMNVTVDPSIIGGVIARVDDKVIDGSVARGLEEIRSAIGKAAVPDGESL